MPKILLSVHLCADLGVDLRARESLVVGADLARGAGRAEEVVHFVVALLAVDDLQLLVAGFA